MSTAPITNATGTAAKTAYLALVAGGMGILGGTTPTSWERSMAFPNAHFVQIVLELFATVQADNVALAMRLACLGGRCHGASKTAVATTEQ